MAPSQLKNEQKLPKMVYIFPNFIVLHFGENFMKIRIENSKVNLQMHKNLHKNLNEHFYANLREFFFMKGTLFFSIIRII